MLPLRPRASALAGLLAFLAVVSWFVLSDARKGDFRVDEAHKISETPFFTLWIRGDVRNPAWFENPIDRTNPPVGKYAFALGILLSGNAVPPLPTLAARTPEGVPPTHRAEESAPYRPLLGAARAVSAVATALIAALLTALLSRLHSGIAGAAASAMFLSCGLAREFAATAVFDPLLSLFFITAIALAAIAATAELRSRLLMLSIGIGVVCAFAFQTRLNGLLLTPIAAMFLRRPRFVLAMCIVFACTALLVNPYYWSEPSVPVPGFSAQPVATRPLLRLLQQKADLERIAQPLRDGLSEGRDTRERVIYAGEMLLGDPGALGSILFALAGAVTAVTRWKTSSASLRSALAMSAVVITTMVLTLPLPWPRYLLVTLPPICSLGGYGLGELSRWTAAILRRTREDEH
jgi:hypothetical protein